MTTAYHFIDTHTTCPQQTHTTCPQQTHNTISPCSSNWFNCLRLFDRCFWAYAYIPINRMSNVLVLVYIHLYLYKHHKQLIRDEKSIQWYFSSFNPHTRPANHPSQPRQLASNRNTHTVNLIAPTPPANPNSAYSTNTPSPRDRIEFSILLSLEVALPKSMVPPQ